MRTFPNDELWQLLLDDEPRCRMLALEFLSEGYASDDAILPTVFEAWERWGAAEAFPGFPMLSHLSVPPAHIAECCDRAARMASRGKLTEPMTRCAGKLLEQVTHRPASELRPHLETICQVAKTSKIFFRVDTSALRQRVTLLEAEAEELATRLDGAIESLSRQTSSVSAFLDGLHALEALRFQHPDYIDMTAAIAQTPPDDGPSAISFQLSMHSLIQFDQVGAEARLARHLNDHREAIYVNAVEALVRIGSPLAAAHLVARLDGEPLANDSAPQQPLPLSAQRWIARGLQRIRAAGLAEELARLRAKTDDPALWLMLLVAEVRQFSVDSLSRITHDLQHVGGYAGALIDALDVYVRAHDGASDARKLQQAFMDYLQLANQALKSKIETEL